MENSQIIRISQVGLKDIDLKVLEVAHALLTDEDIVCELLNNSDLSGEIIVIDNGSEQGKLLYPQLRDSQIKIVLSDIPITSKNTVSLKKPLRVTTLKDILAQVCQQLYDYIATHENIRTNSKLPAAPSSGDTNIFHVLLSAKQEKKYLKVTFSDQNVIFIDGPANTIYTNTENVIPPGYLGEESGQISAEEIEQSNLTKLIQNLTPHALDTELWLTGIECSKGKLLPGHRTDVAVKLKAWPNFSRQGFKAEFFKVAAHIAKQAITLDELSKVSQVPLNIIIDFYNAAFSVGLIEINAQNKINDRQANTMTSDRKTLLGKLAQRLRFA